ncbi:hypothetical protein LguiB_036070 [Lonicera macranthoides]
MFNLSNLIPAEFRSSAKSSLVSFGLGVVFTVTVTGALIGLKRLAWVSQPPKLQFSDKLGACLEENIPRYYEENLPKYHFEAEQKILQRIAQLEEEIEAEKHRGQEEKKRLRRTLKSIAWESDKQELENNLYRFIVRPLAMQAGITYFKVIESSAVAKSAQFPLHVWLPDAMEGPTPISALIHAATMVAAGVFLVARLLPLFIIIPYIMNLISLLGIITVLLGATLALAQKDIKRGLAYSTMSQLGYMMLALGSGSIIHAMETIVGYSPNKSQNMALMGGILSGAVWANEAWGSYWNWDPKETWAFITWTE